MINSKEMSSLILTKDYCKLFLKKLLPGHEWFTAPIETECLIYFFAGEGRIASPYIELRSQANTCYVVPHQTRFVIQADHNSELHFLIIEHSRINRGFSAYYELAGIRQIGLIEKRIFTLLDLILMEYRHPSKDSPRILKHLLRGILSYEINELNNLQIEAFPAHVNYQSPIFRNAMFYINAHFSEKFTLKELAAFCECSLSTLNQKIQEATGKSPHKLILEMRLSKAMEILMNYPQVKITSLAERTGFTNSKHFSTQFRRKYGKSPKQTIKQILSNSFYDFF